jgi:selenocysteine lyase/cysteine desulfurase
MKSHEFGDGPQSLYAETRLKTFDVTRARRETPGAENVLHFNNAGTGLMPQPVIEALERHLRMEAEIGGHEAAGRAERSLSRVYDAAARLLNAEAAEIAVVENAARAWDMVFHALKFAEGDRILTSSTAYAANDIAYLQVARKTGAMIEAIPADDSGQIDVAALENMIDDKVKLISVTHVPTNGGLVNPVAAVGRIAKAAGVPYLLDACQSVGQMPVDVKQIGCDMLSAAGHKYLRGPRGTGLLWLRKELIPTLEPPFLDRHAAEWTGEQSCLVRADARRFESWESFVAGRAGLSVAIDYALSWDLAASYARIQSLADDLRAKLASLPGVSVHDLGVEKCGIVSFIKTGVEPETLVGAMTEQSINIAASHLDMTARNFDALLRPSPHSYNTSEEIDRFCTAVEAV